MIRRSSTTAVRSAAPRGVRGARADARPCGIAVSVYGFEDHNAPPFELIGLCCKDMEEWLKSDNRNVAVVHCKAGKGRTGLMCVCYLLHSGICATLDEALKLYGEKRTLNGKVRVAWDTARAPCRPAGQPTDDRPGAGRCAATGRDDSVAGALLCLLRTGVAAKVALQPRFGIPPIHAITHGPDGQRPTLPYVLPPAALAPSPAVLLHCARRVRGACRRSGPVARRRRSHDSSQTLPDGDLSQPGRGSALARVGAAS